MVFKNSTIKTTFKSVQSSIRQLLQRFSLGNKERQMVWPPTRPETKSQCQGSREVGEFFFDEVIFLLGVMILTIFSCKLIYPRHNKNKNCGTLKTKKRSRSREDCLSFHRICNKQIILSTFNSWKAKKKKYLFTNLNFHQEMQPFPHFLKKIYPLCFNSPSLFYFYKQPNRNTTLTKYNLQIGVELTLAIFNSSRRKEQQDYSIIREEQKLNPWKGIFLSLMLVCIKQSLVLLSIPNLLFFAPSKVRPTPPPLFAQQQHHQELESQFERWGFAKK